MNASIHALSHLNNECVCVCVCVCVLIELNPSFLHPHTKKIRQNQNANTLLEPPTQHPANSKQQKGTGKPHTLIPRQSKPRFGYHHDTSYAN
jgi:hypothetical protein